MDGIEITHFILRYIHFLAGITWIGVLYYFNFIQTPFFGSELGGTARSAMMRGLVPNALWWFRWGAMFTFLSGWAMILLRGGYSASTNPGGALVLTGGLMGTLMWFNVWFVIWPIQKIAIASAEAVAGGGQADPAAAERAPTAARASRTNTLFSIPMLLAMASGSHWSQAFGGSGVSAAYWAIAVALLVLIEANIFITTPAQRPLASVSGTIHAGLGVALILFLSALFVM